MMNLRRGMFTALATVALSLASLPAAAQYQNQNQQTLQTITCSSNSYNNQRQYCRVDTSGGVQISRRLSEASCDQNSSWGYDSNGVWVANGCSAEFLVTGNNNSYGNGSYNNNGQYGNNNGQYGNNGTYNNGQNGNNVETVRCTSKRRTQTRKYCAADTENGAAVTLQQQTSSATCTQGRTWGYDEEGIWVSGGCSGTFAVSPAAANSNTGNYGNNSYGQTIRCTARNRGADKTYCQADTSRGVQMVSQVSTYACTQDSTWGYDSNGIWVSRGCSADFALGNSTNRGWGRRRDTGTYGTGYTATKTVRCESNTRDRQYCAADARGGVHIQREISSNICRQGSTWGYDNGGIWVSNGCRADFEVDGTQRSSVYTGRTTVIPSGSQISIRADEAIDSKNAYVGQRYAADVAEDVVDANGTVIIPRGSQAELILHDANGYNTNNNASASNDSNLVLDLDSVTVNGQRYVTSTEDMAKAGGTGIGANKKTGEYVGGGALLGAIIGAVAGGGKGAAIGAAVGGAAGAGGVILTKGKNVNVPVESVLKFKLDQDLVLQAVR